MNAFPRSVSPRADHVQFGSASTGPSTAVALIFCDSPLLFPSSLLGPPELQLLGPHIVVINYLEARGSYCGVGRSIVQLSPFRQVHASTVVNGNGILQTAQAMDKQAVLLVRAVRVIPTQNR